MDLIGTAGKNDAAKIKTGSEVAGPTPRISGIVKAI